MRTALYTLGIILLCLSLYQLYDFIQFKRAREKSVLETGAATAQELQTQIDTILYRIAEEAKRLADIFGAQELSRQEVERMIRQSALSIPEIQGVTACYEPYAFSEATRLYCPYYDKGTHDFLSIVSKYDYTVKGAESTAWYTEVRDHGARWVEPYFAAGGQDWYVDYGIPFYYSSGPNKGQVRGTITMSFVCSGFQQLVHAMTLGRTGYGLITSNGNALLAHPVNEYIGTTNLADIIAEEPQAALQDAYSHLLQKEVGYTRFYDEQAKDDVLFFYDTIPTSGWGLGLGFYRKGMLPDQQEYQRKTIRLSILVSLLFICVLTIFFNRDHLDTREIWIISILASLVFLFNIVFIGYQVHRSDAIYPNESPPITSVAAIDKIVQREHLRSEAAKTPPLRRVPTGIYLHNLEFEDAYNVNIGGRIWQKYPLSLADAVEIGFVLPQMSPFAEAEYIEEIERDTIPAKEGSEDFLLVQWELRVTLRLHLSYIDFPFDKQRIDIEILPKKANDYLIFTPDLTSYTYTNPDKKSGLSRKISIAGSEVLESYFNYSSETYETDFGYGTMGLFEKVPVLHFIINLKRKLLNAFITYLVPIFVTMIMVFILLNAVGKTRERQGIIEGMAAFFFVLVFSHIDLRREIVSAELTYIEYFYFIAYAMLIITTFNLITYSKIQASVFDYQDNLIFKALYFPLLFLTTLIFTLIQFY